MDGRLGLRRRRSRALSLKREVGGQEFDLGGGAVVRVEPDKLREQIKRAALTVLWFVDSATPSGTPPDPLPGQRCRVVVYGAGGEKLYEEGGLVGDEAAEVARSIQRDVKRVGMDTYVWKKRHGWRID